MKDKAISFLDYNIEFTNEDFECVEKETLKKCKEVLEKVIKSTDDEKTER